jgi:hypothetical protein
MHQGTTAPGLPKHALQHIRNNDKKVRGKGIPLPKAVTTADPVSRNPIKEDSSMPCPENPLHPEAPPIIEPSSSENCQKTGPVNRVEGLPKVNFENNGRGFPGVADSKQICSIDNIFRDTPAREETGLVCVHQGVDSTLEPCGEDLGDSLHDTVLKGDGTKLGRVVGRFCLGEEHQEGSVYASKVNGAIKEG